MQALHYTQYFVAVNIFYIYINLYYLGNFRYSGCGDPWDSKYEWGNMFPVIPKSHEENQRHRQCSRWGCIASALGSKSTSIMSYVVDAKGVVFGDFFFLPP